MIRRLKESNTLRNYEIADILVANGFGNEEEGFLDYYLEDNPKYVASVNLEDMGAYVDDLDEGEHIPLPFANGSDRKILKTEYDVNEFLDFIHELNYSDMFESYKRNRRITEAKYILRMNGANGNLSNEFEFDSVKDAVKYASECDIYTYYFISDESGNVIKRGRCNTIRESQRNRRYDRRRIVSEKFTPDVNQGYGYIDIYNINRNKIAREVNNAIREAVSYINSGDALPTWRWRLGYDGRNNYDLVLGFTEGFDPNDSEFTDSYGSRLALKWATISDMSAMGEYDYDYVMPYDEDTGDVIDSETVVDSYDESRSVNDLIDDFLRYADQVNAENYDDSFDESFRRKRKTVKESRTKNPVRYLPVSVGKRLGIENYPNFSASGSVSGMRKQYYGDDALLVKCGSYIYNVTDNPDIYNRAK